MHFLNTSSYLIEAELRVGSALGKLDWTLFDSACSCFDKVLPRVYRKFGFKSANCQIAHNARRCPERLPCQSKLALGIFFRQLFNYSRPQNKSKPGLWAEGECVKGWGGGLKTVRRRNHKFHINIKNPQLIFAVIIHSPGSAKEASIVKLNGDKSGK